MSKSVYVVFELKVKPGQFDSFKQMVSEVVPGAREEPGTLAYEYSANADGSIIHIFEHYRDSESLVSHVDETFAPFGERFTSLVNVTRLTVYGEPNAAARTRLDNFGAVYLTPFNGFSNKGTIK
ncbi:putative quinol monooxygenase [Azotobacter vinelandii]|uniref:putative quinol monooxygenase n=1 Tax=Azotobacter vinelandii TaxID=354 RepID=UPI0026651CE3|nr:antibiotic biosynthesis monooxygenase family protein [Azotobacter vinelandii]WKN19777.1 antibiotic biosynthesis monooxygenase [Azotobacter vinelandii]